LFVGKARSIGQGVGDNRARLLGRSFATTTTDNTALPKVRNAGNRPAENQIASVMSMLLLLVRRTRMIWPAPVTNPAPRSTKMCRQGVA
jgi:hypothetical protein